MIYEVKTQITETRELVLPFNTEMHHYRKTKSGDGIAAYVNGAVVQVFPAWGYMVSNTGLHISGIKSYLSEFPVEATEEEFLKQWVPRLIGMRKQKQLPQIRE